LNIAGRVTFFTIFSGYQLPPPKLQHIRVANGCREMQGLVVLSSGIEVQRRQIAHALERMFFGGKRIDWADVWDENYYVRLKDGGRAEVKLLPRCPYCKRLTKRA